MTLEDVKRLHKLYSENGNDKARLDLEYWFPDLKVKSPAVKAVVIPKKPSKPAKEIKNDKKSA